MKNAKHQPFDIVTLQKDIEETMAGMPPIETTSPIDYAQLHIRGLPNNDFVFEVPAYLPMTENASAITVASQYEAAAKEVEAMGEALKEASRRAEAMAAKVNEALKFIEETAAAYRSEASLIFEKIERIDRLSESVKNVCEDLRQKIKE